jgi:peptidylprolyl isomerase
LQSPLTLFDRFLKSFPSFNLEIQYIMSESNRLKSTVYVGGLDQAVTTQTLAEAFVPFGEVVDITLPKADAPNSGDAHRGFGYVEFDLPQDAKEAIDNMDGSEIYGRTIKVAAAKPQKDANEGLGSKTAIWEQVRWRYIASLYWSHHN